MRIFTAVRIIVAAVCGLLVTNCSQLPGTLYGAPIDSVYETLKNADLPKGLHAAFSQARTLDQGVDETGTRTMVWDAPFNTEQFKITMKREGDNATRVFIDVIPDPKTATALSPQETAMHKAMAEEFVDSALSNRPYNKKDVNEKMAGWVLGHIGAIQGEALQAAQDANSNTASPQMKELERRIVASQPPVASGEPITGQPMSDARPTVSSDPVMEEQMRRSVNNAAASQ